MVERGRMRSNQIAELREAFKQCRMLLRDYSRRVFSMDDGKPAGGYNYPRLPPGKPGHRTTRPPAGAGTDSPWPRMRLTKQEVEDVQAAIRAHEAAGQTDPTAAVGAVWSDVTDTLDYLGAQTGKRIGGTFRDVVEHLLVSNVITSGNVSCALKLEETSAALTGMRREPSPLLAQQFVELACMFSAVVRANYKAHLAAVKAAAIKERSARRPRTMARGWWPTAKGKT